MAMRRKLGWIAAVACIGMAAIAAVAQVGCKKPPPSPPGAGSERAGAGSGEVKSLRIAMIAKSSTNPVFLSARRGAETAAKDLSAKTGVAIEVVWLTPPQEDGQIQAQRIAQAVNEGADALLISCSDAGKVTGAINDAVARGVPVMTFDSDAPQSKRFSYYGVDDRQLGEDVMSELARLLGGKGRVAILAGNQNATNLRRRVDGIKNEAAKHRSIQIVGTFYHAETPQDAAAEVIRVHNAYPDIKGWAMAGGWALFTKTLLTDLDPKKVKLVAVDALPPQLPYVEKGLAPVLLAQASYLWGNVGVTKIVDKVFFKKDVPELVTTDPVRVTAETLGAWARQLRVWGFPDVPEEYLKLK
jgi:ribose transport system substrate-binding protein